MWCQAPRARPPHFLLLGPPPALGERLRFTSRRARLCPASGPLHVLSALGFLSNQQLEKYRGAPLTDERRKGRRKKGRSKNTCPTLAVEQKTLLEPIGVMVESERSQSFGGRDDRGPRRADPSALRSPSCPGGVVSDILHVCANNSQRRTNHKEMGRRCVLHGGKYGFHVTPCLKSASRSVISRVGWTFYRRFQGLLSWPSASCPASPSNTLGLHGVLGEVAVGIILRHLLKHVIMPSFCPEEF